jgi:hypothetical protein
VSGYALTFGISAGIQALSIPFLRLAQRLGVPADEVTTDEVTPAADPPATPLDQRTRDD